MTQNRLAQESSPYLRQHADNPVDWYPWGDEAFARARREDKPILLSIGYAACHWCHVMAHESFEDDATAAVMNELFVNVKVDREERPDVDSIYMQAVQAMIGHGGWPMTMFLTPEGEPFWGGTYFPPDDRPGMPSFRRVLKAVAGAWRDKRDSVTRTTEAMRDLYRNSSATGGATGEVSQELLDRAARTLLRNVDTKHGGFEGAPKFPQTMALDYLLRWHAQDGNLSALDAVTKSFRAMARGGMYDQVGGGFHRYSVDAEWLVPHFEKMLYDNALLARLGVHLWQVTRDAEVRRITEETLTWVEREMTDARGGWYSSLDADSEGEEGKFYIWDAGQLDELLGDDAPVMRAYWDVRASGNFEGHSILHVPRDPDVIAYETKRPVHEIEVIRQRAVASLYEHRAKREWPGRDEKVLASWNGLMLRAMADAARVWNSDRWRDLAVRNGESLRDHLVREGRVMRVYMEGQVKVPGFLEDHAAVALGFLSLHSLTQDGKWIALAREIGEAMTRQFRDAETGAWYDTASDAEQLITRPRDVMDNATPSGQSLALELMLWLSELDGDSGRRSEAVKQLAVHAEPMSKWPNGFGHLLNTAQLALNGAVAVVLVQGQDASEAIPEFQREVAARYLPTLLLIGTDPLNADSAIPLTEGRTAIDGNTTAYLCRGFACELPATSPAQLAGQLDRTIGA